MAYNGGDKLYANTFTSNACQQVGDFAKSSNPPIGDPSAKEGCMKGASYVNVWMYVIHELEEAIEDCEKSVTPSTHWDEALAFYTGSTTLFNSTSKDGMGYFTYSLAEKKCPLFGTCGVTGADKAYYKSTANKKIFSLFADGSSYQRAGRCDTLKTTKEALVKQFTVPLMQGMMQYLYLSPTDNSEKSKAELWSFAFALLPLIDLYDKNVAKLLRDNSYIRNAVTVPAGYVKVKAAVESVYPAIGITCTDVGGFKDKKTASGYAPDMQPCVDSSTVATQGSTDGTRSAETNMSASAPIAIALIVIVLAFCCFLVGLVGYCFKDKMPRSCTSCDTAPCVPKGDGGKQLFDTHTNTNQV